MAARAGAFDPATIWPDAPGSADAGLLHLRPWRLRVALAAHLAAGEALVWRAPAQALPMR